MNQTNKIPTPTNKMIPISIIINGRLGRNGFKTITNRMNKSCSSIGLTTVSVIII
jgi:hypothetical protein